MIQHISMGDTPYKRSRQLKMLLYKNEITLAGNLKLKIYGTLSCLSGTRMQIQNRVFFNSEEEATQLGYRPCGHCQRKKYKIWKALCR